jgi:DNA (cytosine-5)-methyltransferase 1
MQYSIPSHHLADIYNKQLELFKLDFGSKSSKKISIEYDIKEYSVNSKKSVEKIKSSNTCAIGFFSGAGGLDIGCQLANAKVISSLDFDADSVETMKSNDFFNHTKHFHSDIKDVSAKTYSPIIKANNPEKLILIGGPPCQPFSKAGYWVTHKNRLGSDDPRNMIGQYLRMISELKPNGFILENVESIMHPKNKAAVEELEEAIYKLGYKFIKYRADATEFGVPQKRKRVFFIASKNTNLTVPIRTHGSQADILENPNLLPLERVIDWIIQFDDEKYFEKEELIAGKTYENEVKQIPPGKNYFALTERDSHPNPVFEANKRFWSFLLKLHPLQPSWTIAAQPGPWVGPFHWHNRRLRWPEIAAIQTFPKDYTFLGSRRSKQKQIGNAVPPLLGKAMINHLLKNI